jgi:hypothetical protein
MLQLAVGLGLYYVAFGVSLKVLHRVIGFLLDPTSPDGLADVFPLQGYYDVQLEVVVQVVDMASPKPYVNRVAEVFPRALPDRFAQLANLSLRCLMGNTKRVVCVAPTRIRINRPATPPPRPAPSPEFHWPTKGKIHPCLLSDSEYQVQAYMSARFTVSYSVTPPVRFVSVSVPPVKEDLLFSNIGTPAPTPVVPPVVCVSPLPLPSNAHPSTTSQRTGTRSPRLRSLGHFKHIYVVAHACISPLTLLAGYLLESLVIYLALLVCFYDTGVALRHKMASAAAVHLYLHHAPQEVVLLAVTLLFVMGAYKVSNRG